MRNMQFLILCVWKIVMIPPLKDQGSACVAFLQERRLGSSSVKKFWSLKNLKSWSGPMISKFTKTGSFDVKCKYLMAIYIISVTSVKSCKFCEISIQNYIYSGADSDWTTKGKSFSPAISILNCNRQCIALEHFAYILHCAAHFLFKALTIIRIVEYAQ